MAERRWSLPRLLLLFAGLALILFFVARAGAHQVLAQLGRVGPNALLLLVPYAAGTAIGAFPWRSLLPRRDRPSVRALVGGRFAASSANSLLPFFGMAGEPTRLMWLPSHAHAHGVAAIAVDRMLYNSANGALLVAGAIVAWIATPLPRALAAGALAVGVLTLAATLGGLVLLERVGVGARVQGVLGKLFGDRYRGAELGPRVDAALLEILRGPVRPLLVGAAVHAAGRAVILLEVWVGLYALGTHVGAAPAFALAVVPIAVSFFFSSIPGQVGVQEGAQTLVGAALGMNPALVLSLALLQRFRQLAFAALLPVLLAVARPPRVPSEPGRAATP